MFIIYECLGSIRRANTVQYSVTDTLLCQYATIQAHLPLGAAVLYTYTAYLKLWSQLLMSQLLANSIRKVAGNFSYNYYLHTTYHQGNDYDRRRRTSYSFRHRDCGQLLRGGEGGEGRKGRKAVRKGWDLAAGLRLSRTRCVGDHMLYQSLPYESGILSLSRCHLSQLFASFQTSAEAGALFTELSTSCSNCIWLALILWLTAWLLPCIEDGSYSGALQIAYCIVLYCIVFCKYESNV